MSSVHGATADISRLEHKIVRIAAQKRRVDRMWLLCRWAGLLLALVFGYFLADWLTHFPRIVRIAVSLALPVLTWRYASHRWKNRLFNDVSVLGGARLLERLAPKFNSFLVSTVDFAKNLEAPGGSPLLRQHTIQVTQGAFDEYAGLQVAPPERWSQAAVRLLVPALCFGAAAAISPMTVAVFGQRMVGLDVPYPTRTTILDVTHPSRIANDQDAEILVRTAGVDPEAGTLRLRFEGQSPADLNLEWKGEHTYAMLIRKPPTTFEFELAIGDAPVWHGRVDVAAPPAEKTIRFQVEPPAYAGLPSFGVDRGSFSAPEGCKLSLEMVPNRECSTCRLVLPEAKVDLKFENGAYRHTFSPKNSFAYRFELKDREGLANSLPAEYQIELLPDRPPDVLVMKPELDRMVAPMSLIPLEFKANDTLGLKEAFIEYYVEQIATDQSHEQAAMRTQDANVPRSRVAIVEHIGQKHLEFKNTFAVSKFKVDPGNLIRYRIAVRDSCPGREQIAYSDERTLRVVTARELAQALAERQAQMLQTLGKITDDEAAAHKRLQEILNR